MKPRFTSELIDVYPYKRESGVVLFLLLKRSAKVIYANQWRMIGGKIETGETAVQAAQRELQEETGIKPQQFWCVPSVNIFFDFKSDRVHQIPVFSAELPDMAPVLNHEHSEFGWFPAEKAAALLSHPEQKRLITLINSILTENRICSEWIVE